MPNNEDFDLLPPETRERLAYRAVKLRQKELRDLSDDDLAVCIWYGNQLMLPDHVPLPENPDVLNKYLDYVAWLAELKQEWVRRRYTSV